MAQKWSILNQNRPNMEGLSTFQSVPKGSRRDQNGQPKCYRPFTTLLGLSGLFWTIENKKLFFLLWSTSAQRYFVHLGQKIYFSLGQNFHICRRPRGLTRPFLPPYNQPDRKKSVFLSTPLIFLFNLLAKLFEKKFWQKGCQVVFCR